MAKSPEINADIIRGLTPVLCDPEELSAAHGRAEFTHPFLRFAHSELIERFRDLVQPGPEELDAIENGIIAYEALAATHATITPPEHALTAVRGFLADPRFNLGIRASLAPETRAFIQTARPLATGIETICEPQLTDPYLTRYALCGAAMIRAAHLSAIEFTQAA